MGNVEFSLRSSVDEESGSLRNAGRQERREFERTRFGDAGTDEGGHCSRYGGGSHPIAGQGDVLNFQTSPRQRSNSEEPLIPLSYSCIPAFLIKNLFLIVVF